VAPKPKRLAPRAEPATTTEEDEEATVSIVRKKKPEPEPETPQTESKIQLKVVAHTSLVSDADTHTLTDFHAEGPRARARAGGHGGGLPGQNRPKEAAQGQEGAQGTHLRASLSFSLAHLRSVLSLDELTIFRLSPLTTRALADLSLCCC
jgi:hypothetical protein